MSIKAVLLSLVVAMAAVVAVLPAPVASGEGAPSTPAISSFQGIACLDADCGGGAQGKGLVVRVGGVECGSAIVSGLIDGPLMTTYHVEVASAVDIPGCGTEGATVEFYIDGRLAKPTGVWHASASQNLGIWAGEDFAAFSGQLFANGEPWPWPCSPGSLCYGPMVRAFISSTLCGEKRVEGLLLYAYYSLLVVLPDSLRPGCGEEGDPIAFTVNDLPADQTATWTAGFHTLDLNVTEPAVTPIPPTPSPIPPTPTPTPSTPTPTVSGEPAPTLTLTSVPTMVGLPRVGGPGLGADAGGSGAWVALLLALGGLLLMGAGMAFPRLRRD